MINSKYKNLYYFLFLNTLVAVCFNMAHPVTPQMLQDKGMRDSLNGILFSFMSLGMVLFSPIWGKILYDIGLKKILIFSIIGYGISQEILGFSPTATGMIIGRLLSGIFACGWSIAVYELLNIHAEADDKIRFFGYVVVSNTIGVIAGQLFSGFIAIKTSIYFPFVLQLVFLTMIGIVVFFTISNEDLQPKKLKNNNFETSPKQNNNLEKIKVKNNFVVTVIVMFVIMIFSLAWTGYKSQIGYFVSDKLGKTPMSVGEINSYNSFVVLIMNMFFLGILSKHIKEDKILILGFITSFLGLIILKTHINGSSNFIGITLFIIGVSVYRPVAQGYLLKVSNSSSNALMGYVNSANAIGMVGGSLVTGILYEINPTLVLNFLFIAIISGILILTIYKIYEKI